MTPLDRRRIGRTEAAALALLLSAAAGVGCSKRSSPPATPLEALPPAALDPASLGHAAASAIQSMNLGGVVGNLMANQPLAASAAPPTLRPASAPSSATSTVGDLVLTKPRTAGQLVLLALQPARAAAGLVSLAVQFPFGTNESSLALEFPCAADAVGLSGNCPDVASRTPGSCTFSLDLPGGCVSYPSPSSRDRVDSIAGSASLEAGIDSYTPMATWSAVGFSGFSLAVTGPSDDSTVVFDGTFASGSTVSADPAGRLASVVIPGLTAVFSDGTTTGIVLTSEESIVPGISDQDSSRGEVWYRTATGGLWVATVASTVSMTHAGGDAFGAEWQKVVTLGTSRIYNEGSGSLSGVTRDASGAVVRVTVNGTHTWGVEGVGRIGATARDLALERGCAERPRSGSLTLTNGSDTAVLEFSGGCGCSIDAALTGAGGNRTVSIDLCSTGQEFGP